MTIGHALPGILILDALLCVVLQVINDQKIRSIGAYAGYLPLVICQ